MPIPTTRKGLEKPLENSPIDEDVWGGILNEDFNILDINEDLEQTIMTLRDKLSLRGF